MKWHEMSSNYQLDDKRLDYDKLLVEISLLKEIAAEAKPRRLFFFNKDIETNNLS